MFNLFKKTIRLYSTETGFTLLEVMMAVLIIGIGLVGVSSLIVQNIQVQYINKNVLIASQLAQEGLELVRNIRDENWLIGGNDWDENISDGSANYTFTIDYLKDINDTVNSIDEDGAKLYINGNDFYTHTSTDNTETNFYRLITVNDLVSYLEVKCIVRSEERERTHDYAAETVLYDWR